MEADYMMDFYNNTLPILVIYDLFVSFIAGVLIGRDAVRRGMSGLGWGLFTMIALVIALPLYAIVRRPEV